MIMKKHKNSSNKNDFVQEQLQIEIPIYINIPTEQEQRSINQNHINNSYIENALVDAYANSNVLE